MPPPKIETSQDLASLIVRIERERDSLKEQFDEAIQRLRKFQEVADGLTGSSIDNVVWQFTQDLPPSTFTDGDESPPSPPVSSSKPPRYSGTVFDRMVQFFTEFDNKPASNARIREAIGSNRGTVAMVLYNTHPTQFEKVKLSEDHIVYWRLKESFYDTLMKSQSDQPSAAKTLPRPNENDDIPF